MDARRVRSRLIATITGCLLAWSCTGRDPILIGLAGPFSEPRGASMRQAAELAVREVNRAGGIDGRDLQLVVADDSADAQAAVRVAQSLYDNRDVVAVIGHLTSGATLAAAAVYNGGSAPVLEISPSASNPAVSRAGPYTFRTCPSDLLHGAELARWASDELGAVRAAVLYENDDYGRGVRRSFIESFVTTGGEIVTDHPYLPTLPSFRPFLDLTRTSGGADVLLIAGSARGAARVIQTLDSLGFTPAILGGDGLTGVQDGGIDADGVLVSTAYLPDRPGPENEAFVTTYRAAYGNALPDHRGAGAYDIVHLLADGLGTVGPNRRRLRDYVASIGSDRPAYAGVTGAIAFDANGDVPTKDVVIGEVAGTQLVSAERR